MEKWVENLFNHCGIPARGDLPIIIQKCCRNRVCFYCCISKPAETLRNVQFVKILLN